MYNIMVGIGHSHRIVFSIGVVGDTVKKKFRKQYKSSEHAFHPHRSFCNSTLMSFFVDKRAIIHIHIDSYYFKNKIPFKCIVLYPSNPFLKNAIYFLGNF